jgi:hypothetical protein
MIISDLVLRGAGREAVLDRSGLFCRRATRRSQSVEKRIQVLRLAVPDGEHGSVGFAARIQPEFGLVVLV